MNENVAANGTQGYEPKNAESIDLKTLAVKGADGGEEEQVTYRPKNN